MDSLQSHPTGAGVKRNSVLWAKFNALSLVTSSNDSRPAPVFEDPAIFRAKAGNVKFPNHQSVPLENVFMHKAPRDPKRLVAILENYIMTPAGIQRAQQFRPKRNDCIVTSAPECGEDFVCRIVRFLQSDKPLEVVNDRNTTAPWIESRYCDDDPEILDKLQNRRGRVFKTGMSVEMCKPKNHAGVKYIAVVRHPIDLRAQWIRYLQKCYEVESEDDPLPDFDGTFNVDDFVQIPVTLCHVQSPAAAKLYEFFVQEWAGERTSNKSQVLIICFEALVNDPVREIKKIAGFLQLPVYDDLITIILKDLAKEGIKAPKLKGSLEKAKRRMTRILLPGEKTRRKTEGAPLSPGAKFGCGLGSQLLNKDSCDLISGAWRRIVTVEVAAPTYADFYSLFGQNEDYPYPQQDDPVPRSQMLASANKAVRTLSSRLAKTPSAIAQSPQRLRSYRKEKEIKKKVLMQEKQIWKKQQNSNPMAGVAEIGSGRDLSVDALLDRADEPPVPPMPPVFDATMVELPPPSDDEDNRIPAPSHDEYEENLELPPPPLDAADRRQTVG